MRTFFRRIADNKSGFYLALAAVVIVVGWHAWVLSHKPAHWEEIASELGSIPQFGQLIYASDDGAVVYTRFCEDKTGFFFCGGATQKAHLLCETIPDFYGWSPDGSRLAYGMLMPSGNWETVICDGNSGEQMAVLEQPGLIDPSMFAWLSSRSFGYLLKQQVGFDFGMFEQKSDGTWVRGKTVSGVTISPNSFTAVSETSVAWGEQHGVNQVAYSGRDQQWKVTLVGGNQYKITAQNGLALAGPTNESQLVLQAYTGEPDQLWTFTANGTNYNIMNVGSGENMDDWWGGSGNVVGQWEGNGTSANQLWKLTRVGGNPPGSTPIDESNAIADGTYEITCPSGGDYALNYSNGGEDIKLLDISSGSVTTIWESSTANNLSEFIYSRKTGEFLLNCPDEKGCHLIRYYPPSKWTADAGRIDTPQTCTFRRDSKWTDDSPTFISSWNDGSPRSVYLSDDGLNTFCISTNTNSNVISLPWRGGVAVHTSLYGNHLYIVGDPANEPPGIWDYDIASGSLNCIVPDLEQPFKYAKYATPICGEVTNNSGNVGCYTLWQPANFSPQKKYPVIIGQTVNAEWLPYEQVAANSGCYFAVVHRPYWMSKKLQDWPADVMGLYELLAKNPNIDTNRVFLWGHSVETVYLCQLFEEKPQLWNGIILFDPSDLPDVTTLKHKKILIIAGKDSDAQQLVQYSDQAAQAGIPLKFILLENDKHNPESTRSVRARTLEFARFLIESL